MTLPTDVVEGQADHAGLHNDVNAAVNALQSQSAGGRRPPGSYYVFPITPAGAGTNGSLGNDTLRLAAAYFPVDLTVIKVGAEVTVAGTTGCTLRLAIYADDGTGVPGELAIDAGTIPGDAVGAAEVTLGAAVTLPAGYYWLGAVVQGTPASQPTVRAIAGGTHPAQLVLKATSNTPSAGQSIYGMSGSGIPGALPETLSSPSGSASPPARLFIKIAA